MSDCLYNCGSGEPSTQRYHIIPYSGSLLKVQLDKGIVCDKCNSYFSKLEQYFIDRHPGSSNRLLTGMKTRKGKTPKFTSEAGTATRTVKDGLSEITFPLNDLEIKQLDNGDLLIIGTFTPFPFDSVKIGRVLSKIALEFLYVFPNDHELESKSSRLDPLRRYARFGPGKAKFFWFAWKRDPLQQKLPCVKRIDDDGGNPIAFLCRISFPELAYLLPLIPDTDPKTMSKNLEGWNLVETPGIITLKPERIELTAIRVPPKKK